MWLGEEVPGDARVVSIFKSHPACFLPISPRDGRQKGGGKRKNCLIIIAILEWKSLPWRSHECLVVGSMCELRLGGRAVSSFLYGVLGGMTSRFSSDPHIPLSQVSSRNNRRPSLNPSREDP